jgi:uncharacterized protein (DUF302 family)
MVADDVTLLQRIYASKSHHNCLVIRNNAKIPNPRDVNVIYNRGHCPQPDQAINANTHKMATISQTSEAFTGTRLTKHSGKPFDAVLERLRGTVGTLEKWTPITQKIKSANGLLSVDEFRAEVLPAIDGKDFMTFMELDHGLWLPIYGVGEGRKAVRVVLGNPLIAITMLQHDLNAALSVPVEILLLEDADKKGTSVVYFAPSGLIASINKKEELVVAVNILDEKLAALVTYILS